MSTRSITLADAPNHINQYLTHWTGRGKNTASAFDALSSIVNTKRLMLTMNQTTFPNPRNIIDDRMICFTDTPLSQSLDHCKLYGCCGISFNKEKLITYGANPVLYLTDNRKDNQSYLNGLSEKENARDLLLLWCCSITQPYNSKANDPSHVPEFYEREWRISCRVTQQLSENESTDIRGPYNEYPFEGEMIDELDKHERRVSFLSFNKEIIESIIVPPQFSIQAEELVQRNQLDADVLIIANPFKG